MFFLSALILKRKIFRKMFSHIHSGTEIDYCELKPLNNYQEEKTNEAEGQTRRERNVGTGARS
jgi:hypothetical protein